MIFIPDAYRARIGLTDPVTVDADGLTLVQRAHRLAIPFETLDIRLGRGIRIDSQSVFSKIVIGKRGGYCFEQNRLLIDALTAFGFEVRPLLARVRLGATEVPPLTHTLSLVTIGGQPWIADAGFGGSYAPPMPLIAGHEAGAPDGALFRLITDARGWVLQRVGPAGSTDGRDTGSDWVDQFSFTLEEVAPADLAMANHWTATAPGSRFVDHVIASIVLPHGFASLTDRAYRRYAAGEDNQAVIEDPRVYRMRMSLMFGIDLTAEEVTALGLFD